MNVILDLCVVPLGVGVSVSKYVAACQVVFKDAGLPSHLHPYGTTVEGEWDRVLGAVKRCHEVIHEMGEVRAPRISATIKLGTRTDRPQTMDDKVRSVQAMLAAGMSLVGPYPWCPCVSAYLAVGCRMSGARSSHTCGFRVFL